MTLTLRRYVLLRHDYLDQPKSKKDWRTTKSRKVGLRLLRGKSIPLALFSFTARCITYSLLEDTEDAVINRTCTWTRFSVEKIKAYRIQDVKREVLNINYVIYTEITNLKTDENNLVKIAEISRKS